MRILITGGRTWRDSQIIYNALAAYTTQHTVKNPVTVISGHNPRGADHLAEEAAKKLHFRLELHPADWEKFGKAAGMIRNRQMVDTGADVCLAFPTRESKGTWGCVKDAKKANIPVSIFYENK